MLSFITLYINGKEDGEYASWFHLNKRLKELAQEYPKADLATPVECGCMNVEISNYQGD
jgi:hypothetical protein